jgi:hypothetical protein
MTPAQFKSLQRFIETGSTLKDLKNYFLLKSGNGKDIVVYITPDGLSVVWELTLFARINPDGEAFI